MTIHNMGSVTLSSSANSISISDITNNSDIKILCLQISLRGDSASLLVDAGIRFNSDSGNNYANLVGNFGPPKNLTTVPSGALTDPTSYACLLKFPGNSGTATTFSTHELWIYSYNDSSKFKNVYLQGGVDQNAFNDGSYATRSCGTWRSTSNITSISLHSLSGNFVSGSKLTLLGLAGG